MLNSLCGMIGAYVMKVLAIVLLIVILSLGTNLAIAAPDPAFDAATAAVTVTVDEIIEWDNTVNGGNFETIAIDPITNQADTPSASKSLVLYTNCDLDITADNSATAQLTKTTDTLVTEYKLEYDKNGTNGTGGATVDWTLYNNFLTTPSAVTHVSLDGAVNVTLSARASNDAGNVADAGNYTATQTLTASF
jgi:hypothetical protein